mgnify:CR=1 FL=1
MPFYRRDLETLKVEEISEADLRHKMAGYYRDVDLVVKEMVEHETSFSTPVATYGFSRGAISTIDIYTDDKKQIFVDDGKDVWGLKFREVEEAKVVLKYLMNVGHKLKSFGEIKDSIRYRFPDLYFEEEYLGPVPQIGQKKSL